ncbi:MAG: class I mannose-6-phosphate isomerase [Treponema sp.]|nr:class I mannose-6-phosphate isomerase [Treponema sp.]
MNIFKLKPACKDYLWGGHRLVEEFGIKYEGDVCAEAWVLSCHKDGESIITSGIHKNRTLSELIASEKDKILGTNCSKFEEFPILIKLIDAKKPLSIQVHPDDEYAREHENQYGKTEMWYILGAEEGAFLYQGFEKEITKEEFEKRIKENTLEEVLHKVYVKKGDVIFIAPGTLHAIGAGIILAEIQQSSNVTYRIYDYGRLGADGRPRQLHIKQSIDVTKLEKPAPYTCDGEHLAKCKYFCVDQFSIKVDAPLNAVADEKSFVSVLVVDGNCMISSESEEITARKGESVFISAGTGKYTISGQAEIVVTTIP